MTLSQQALRFLAVGGVATAVHYVILVAIVHYGQADAVTGSTIGFVISSIFNYTANRQLTFRSVTQHRIAIPRFLAVAGVGLILNAAAMAWLHGSMHWHYLFAQAIATFLTLLWNFTFNKLWTFAA